MQYYCLTTGRGKNVGGAIHLIGILLISYKLSETLIFKRMDKRQQPSRLARKRMSEDIETDDQDEMDDLQARLDKILGSDSGSEYTPDKDSQSYDEDDDDPRETKNKDDEAIPQQHSITTDILSVNGGCESIIALCPQLAWLTTIEAS